MRAKQPPYFIIFCFIILLCLAFSIPASAQASRSAEWAAKQAEKANELRPYKPNKAEEWLDRIEDWGLLNVPKGPYPFFGSAYSGGGFALGAGFRSYYSDSSFWDIHGAWSISNYRMLDATFQLPDMASGYLKSSVNTHYVHAGKVPYFGIGNDTTQDQEASYLYNPFTVEYTLAYHPNKYFSLGGSFAYEDYQIGSGDRPNVPSIEEVYDPVTAPSLGTDPQYTVPGIFARLDWLQSPGYNTRGGMIEVDWQKYSEKNDLNFDFQRMDVEARQFIPILRANQVLALRALASFTDIEDVNQVPFFMLPKLGGGEELRGFGDFRFRDRHRMLLSAEYRWTPSKFMDLAIFYEAGKVASRTEDLDFSDLHDCYGIGVRFHTPVATPLRIEFAHSVEGNRIIFSGGTSF